MPKSARSLAKANLAKAIKTATGQDPDPNALAPGHMRLYSYYSPSLLPGPYGIEVEQVITAGSGTGNILTIFNSETPPVTTPPTAPTTLLQQFNVIAPRFQIDPKVVNSVYPPPGYSDEGRVLPHIVFNDPHLPWDRTLPFPTLEDPRRTTEAESPSRSVPKLSSIGSNALLSNVPSSAAKSPNLVPKSEMSIRGDQPLILPPWMALVVFDAAELKLTSADETTLGIPPPATTTPSTLQPQQVKPSSGQVSTPGSYSMSVGDYLTKITSRVNYESLYAAGQTNPGTLADFQALQSSTDPTSIIFPLKSLVKTIFTPNAQFFLLSHVRQINTVGFPDAGVEEEGLYSVCISKRTGPTAASSNPAPVTQVVHLVSLEYIDQSALTSKKPFKEPFDRIGLVSLYSWTYLSVPPNPINFQQVMTNLANNLQMLTPLTSSLSTISSSISTQKTPELTAAAQHLYDRLTKGYTISRWRTSVGQETVAFTRGPLTPLSTPWKPSVTGDWPGSSNSGKDYQILDQDLGVMDVSYSAAWQLGKLMAISDNVFNQALFRFRSLVHQFAASDTRKQANAVLVKSAVLGNIPNTVDELHKATDGTRTPARLILSSSNKVAPPLSDPQVAPIFKQNLFRIIDAQTAAGEAIYSDYNLGSANNSDWEVINQWISDKLFLGGIPAQYLFPDPSFLPSEALRFFYIDRAWMDCFIDGALSVGNHLEPVDDKVRRRIKDVYNVYLSNNIDPAPVKPPVPRYGFILRSALIKVMPDIRITVTCRTSTGAPDTTRVPLVRLTKMDDYTILALLDCLPEELLSIVFAQPPHQQRYVAFPEGYPNTAYQLRQLYTSNAPTGEWLPLVSSKYPTAADQATWYDPDPTSRCLNVIFMAEDIGVALTASTGVTFADAWYDSAILALELNDPSYQLTVLPPAGSNPPTAADETRQLWVGVDVSDSDDPIQPAEPVIIHSPIGPIHPQSAAAVTPTIHPPTSGTIKSADRALPLNLSRQNVLAAKANPKSRAATTPVAATPATTLSPQFSLAIHPDYRGPPPLPYVGLDGSITYSSHDFIPTTTTYLFDLIFSLTHQPPSPAIPYPLVSLSITIPDDTDLSSSNEPLLRGVYAGAGAIMLKNKRLIPFLTSSVGSLTILLTPRDKLPDDTTTDSIPVADMSDASFRLAQAPIAGVQNPVRLDVLGGAGSAKRGLCAVVVKETYLLTDGTTTSVENTWEVVKKDGGDVDLSGSKV